MQRVALVVAAIAALSLSSIDALAQYAPWCAYYTFGASNCGFNTYAQCQAALSGIGGTCSRNPASQSSGDQRRQRY